MEDLKFLSSYYKKVLQISDKIKKRTSSNTGNTD